MARCRVDQSIKRVEVGGFAFPLGVYPVDPVSPPPRSGYTTAFEPADDGSGDGPGGVPGDEPAGGVGDGEDGPGLAGNGGGGEERPHRQVYALLGPPPRGNALCRPPPSLLPGRVYPILDFLGQDEWREVDPYVSYDLLGMDRFTETLRRFHGFFFEDGLVGFGAMSEEPFLYVFVDEHKVVTVRVEAAWKDRVEKALGAFDLEPIEELLSADSATHEHRSVLEVSDDRPDLLSADEIVEVLRDEWRLVLNIDPETNVDEEGHDLGVTGWRCILRCDPPSRQPEAEGEEAEAEEREEPAPRKSKRKSEAGTTPSGETAEAATTARYAEVFLTADSYHTAMDLALTALESLFEKSGMEIDPENTPEPVVVIADRWNAEDFVAAVEKATGQRPDMIEPAAIHAVWLN